VARKDAIRALNEASGGHPQHLCTAEYQGVRCQYFWVVSQSTHGGPGLCNQHSVIKFGERFKQIIEESHGRRVVAAPVAGRD
jgi:hypothetical protein